MKSGMALTVERIEELFRIDLVKGKLWHKGRSIGGQPKGRRAGYVAKHGYRIICIDYVDYFEHNLIWFLAYGQWPPSGVEVDHINRIRKENQLRNLRLGSRSLNNANMRLRRDNKAGYRGVHFNKEKNKFCAQVTKDGKTKSLGYFTTAEEAARAAAKVRQELFGEFAYHPGL